MDSDAKEILERSNEYLNRVFGEVDSELVRLMPPKLVFFAVHQIVMKCFPGYVTASQMVEMHGTEGNKAFLAEGLARAVECMIAKAWDRKHSDQFISEPLPEKFRKCLELPAMFAGERPQ